MVLEASEKNNEKNTKCKEDINKIDVNCRLYTIIDSTHKEDYQKMLEILQDAKIVYYYYKTPRYNYLCLEKDGKHYVLKLEVEFGWDSLIVSLFGPRCEKARAILNKDGSWMYDSSILYVASLCW